MSPLLTSPRQLRYQWLSTREMAVEYRRDESTIRRWCENGTLTDFGFRTYRSGSSWWIHLPGVVSRAR